MEDTDTTLSTVCGASPLEFHGTVLIQGLVHAMQPASAQQVESLTAEVLAIKQMMGSLLTASEEDEQRCGEWHERLKSRGEQLDRNLDRLES